MKIFTLTFVVASVICIMLSASLLGQTQTATDAQFSTDPPAGAFGVGFQGSFPAYGASAIINFSPNFALQGVVGALGELRSIFGRAIVRFNRSESGWGWHNLYAFGMVGSFSYPWFDDSNYRSFEETRESAPGFGAGLGFEGYLNSIPEVGWTLEIGLGSVSFEKADYTFSTVNIGGGLHYYFGGGK